MQSVCVSDMDGEKVGDGTISMETKYNTNDFIIIIFFVGIWKKRKRKKIGQPTGFTLFCYGVKR